MSAGGNEGGRGQFFDWRAIAALVYLAAVCGIVHFIWRVKADLRAQPAAPLPRPGV